MQKHMDGEKWSVQWEPDTLYADGILRLIK